MLFRELSTAPRQPLPTTDFLGMAQRLCERHGFITPARRKEILHIVDVHGLNRTRLTEPGEFERELSLRIKWCRTNAPDFAVELIGPNSKQVRGRRFRFCDISMAALFRGMFSTDIKPETIKVG